jgi:hypothetical protein
MTSMEKILGRIDRVPMQLSLWRLNPLRGTWDHERHVTSETAGQWLQVFQKGDPASQFVVAAKKPTTEAERFLRAQSAARKKSLTPT